MEAGRGERRPGPRDSGVQWGRGDHGATLTLGSSGGRGEPQGRPDSGAQWWGGTTGPL